MSELMRMDPFNELLGMQRRLDRMFGSLPVKSEPLETELDMYETDSEITIKVSVPGYKPEDVQVTLTGDTLTIKGEVKREQENKDEKRNYIMHEIRRGSFQRVIVLPVGLKGEDAKAEFDNGLLVLTIPKSEEIKPRTIQVKPKQVAGG